MHWEAGAQSIDKYRSPAASHRWCLPVTYEKLGRHANVEVALANMKASQGDAAAYQYATICAQWGDTARALQWLETAMRVRDPGLGYLLILRR
jgi:hypothetical protein